MAAKARGKPVELPVELEGQLAMFAAAALDGDVADWTAINQVELGNLVRALVAADAGVMFRASERRSACSVGVFVGGASRWVTCRDQRELLAVLDAAQNVLEAAVGLETAPQPEGGPARKGKPRRTTS